MTHNKRRAAALPPPPAPSELAFQQFQFDNRIDKAPPKFQLGASFFGSHGRDFTVKGQLVDKLKKAGDRLRVLDFKGGI